MHPNLYNHRQVAEQLLAGGVLLALAVTVNHRDQPVGSGALRVEIVDGRAGRIGVGFIGHCRKPRVDLKEIRFYDKL